MLDAIEPMLDAIEPGINIVDAGRDRGVLVLQDAHPGLDFAHVLGHAVELDVDRAQVHLGQVLGFVGHGCTLQRAGT
jgi:hypothetical protein